MRNQGKVTIVGDMIGRCLQQAFSTMGATPAIRQANAAPKRPWQSGGIRSVRGRGHHSPYKLCVPKHDSRSNRRKAKHRARMRRRRAA